MNKNSIEAWNRIRGSKKISELRGRIAEAIAWNPDQTANELASCQSLRGIQQHSITPRFKELEVMGVIVRRPARICSVTGHLADTYDINLGITEASIRPFKRPQRYRAPILLPIRTRDGLNEAIRQKDVILLQVVGLSLTSMDEGQIALLQKEWNSHSKQFTFYRCRFPDKP